MLSAVLKVTEIKEYNQSFFKISDNDMSNFVVRGILICLVACFGVLSNIISIYIYSRPKMKTPINCILIGNYVLTNLAN